ncbi:hypothetical protein [Actinomyces sp.]|uniref:hypothetical protein n=1 Tax=Actinomyces sp. TaxID=29317 RepID=UPI0026DDC179|nr:hypothetical protein [Actinomyces sp.]MDO4899036.1 hypothetical protein [Actinomyces sp.]
MVADAGMLSATNLEALDQAGLGFIVGSRTAKAPADLAAHYRWHGDALAGRAGDRYDHPTSVHALDREGRQDAR